VKGELTTANASTDPSFASASEWNSPGGVGGRPPSQPGGTLWFTGLPSAGKSTVAHALADRLRADGVDVEVLDGDEVRPHLSAGLGFTRADRDVNVRRIGWVARLLASHGTVVLVPVIAPYADARQAVRDDHQANDVPYGEIYVSTALEVAEQRDVKGLYARARRGEIRGLTGVDDPYEQPATAELELDTAALDLETSVAKASTLLSAILDRPVERTPL
jgi:adenylylsulfate kinase